MWSVIVLPSLAQQTSQERRVVVLHRQLKVTPDPLPAGDHFLARDRVLGGPLVFLPVQARTPLPPQSFHRAGEVMQTRVGIDIHRQANVRMPCQLSTIDEPGMV